MTRIVQNTLISAVFISFSAVIPVFAANPMSFLSEVDSEAPGYSVFFDILQRLEADGSEIVEIEHTFLGRVRVVSALNGILREVVLSPNTGEIRRDIIVGTYDGPGLPEQSNGVGHAYGKDKGKGKGKAKGKDK